MSYRKISFNITWWSYSGIRIPNSSIIEENNLKYVMKKTSKGNEKILVKILRKNDNYSIVSSYSLEDLQQLGVDSSENTKLNIYDAILISP